MNDELEGQMNIFDFIDPGKKKDPVLYWDDDINYISEFLNEWISKVGLTKRRESFTIWSHVPVLGYRLEIKANIRPDIPESDWNELEEFQKEMKKTRKVELSANVTPYGTMFSTLFLDGRRNIKK